MVEVQREIHESVTVGCRLEDLADILAERPEGWLRPFLRIASQRGEHVATRLQATFEKPSLRRLSLKKTVKVRLGDPATEESPEGIVITIPIRWEAAGYRSLFPVFNGAFILRPVSDDATQVTIRGLYDPPGGAIGDLVDKLIAHRAAEASIRALLGNLRIGVEELIRILPPE